MFCKNCGSQINDDAVVCPNCGVATEKMPAAATAQPAVQKTNGFAIAGLVLAIIGACGGNYGFCVPSILGLVFSIIGMIKCKKEEQGGYGLAIGGLVVSIIGLVFWAIVWIVAFQILLGMTAGV